MVLNLLDGDQRDPATRKISGSDKVFLRQRKSRRSENYDSCPGGAVNEPNRMKKLPILALLLIGMSERLPAPIVEQTQMPGADEKKMTVVDYYLRLPDKTFEGPAADWLRFLKQPKCGVVDLANGYMSCVGDGAQPPFEVALFRYRDPARAGLLALCQGELEGEKSLFLDF